MRIIAHRGNTHGPCDSENGRSHIRAALEKGFDVEVDIWKVGSSWYLGHDRPQYLVDLSTLEPHKDRLWIHCKNYEALDGLEHANLGFNFFWHEEDLYALTSLGFIWTYPEVFYKGEIYAYCTDYPQDLKSSHEVESKED